MVTLAENTANSRIQIHDVAMASPGKCAVCGYAGGEAGIGRQFIDIGWNMEDYGAVYFCTDCILEVSNYLGYGSPDQTAKLLTENMALSDRIVELENERNSLNRTVRDLFNGRSGTGARNESEVLPETTPASKRPTPRSKPITAKQGPTNVSDVDGDSNDIISLG